MNCPIPDSGTNPAAVTNASKQYDSLVHQTFDKSKTQRCFVKTGGWSTLFKPITPSDVKIGIGLN